MVWARIPSSSMVLPLCLSFSIDFPPDLPTLVHPCLLPSLPPTIRLPWWHGAVIKQNVRDDEDVTLQTHHYILISTDALVWEWLPGAAHTSSTLQLLIWTGGGGEREEIRCLGSNIPFSLSPLLKWHFKRWHFKALWTRSCICSRCFSR